MTNLTVPFRNFANSPKNINHSNNKTVFLQPLHIPSVSNSKYEYSLWSKKNKMRKNKQTFCTQVTSNKTSHHNVFQLYIKYKKCKAITGGRGEFPLHSILISVLYEGEWSVSLSSLPPSSLYPRYRFKRKLAGPPNRS